MHTTKWILGLVVTLAGVGLSREARADVKFCNQTGQSVMVELAYMNSACFASGGFRDVVWYRIDPGQCRTLLYGDSSDRHYFYYARSASAVWAAPSTPYQGALVHQQVPRAAHSVCTDILEDTSVANTGHLNPFPWVTIARRYFYSGASNYRVNLIP
jgi:hypothetical protein